MQNSNVVISIILCCYNSEKYLEETLQSIVDQTFKNWELITVNDGSQDNTLKILNEFVRICKNFTLLKFKKSLALRGDDSNPPVVNPPSPRY